MRHDASYCQRNSKKNVGPSMKTKSKKKSENDDDKDGEIMILNMEIQGNITCMQRDRAYKTKLHTKSH